MIDYIFYILGGLIIFIFIYEFILKPFFKGISEAVTDYYAKKKFEERQEDYKKKDLINMGHEEYVRNELKEYLKLARDFDIEINGKNFVDLVNIIGGNYFEY